MPYNNIKSHKKPGFPTLFEYRHMYIFFEKGTRIGIPYISNRYRKANSIYLKSHNPKQDKNQTKLYI